MPILRAGAKLTQAIVRFPVFTNGIITGGLMATGDAIAQHLFEPEDAEYDWARTARMTTVGAFIIAPTVVFWYRYLELRLGSNRWPIKVALDQIFMAPILNAVVMPTLDVMAGRTFDQAEEHMKADYVDIMIANYKVWPFVQCVNFGILPLHFRPAFVQTVALCWNTYYAWKVNQQREPEPLQKGKKKKPKPQPVKQK